MKGLNTNTLLKNLVRYSFFDWDNEGNGTEPLLLGMPEAILKQHQVEEFYHSWGIEAVHNPHAHPSFSAEDWLRLENDFFDWLNIGKHLLFPDGSAIVTPSLQQDWFFNGYDPDKNEWMKYDFEQYENLLLSHQIIQQPPSLREDYRGAVVENFEEFKITSKMSIRGVPLLFFSNNEMVITITDYLTIKIHFKNNSIKEKKKYQLIDIMNPQFLR
ncbi:hypothetical protein [Thermoactinomyces sp. CICC 10522]|uniref:hypothetical protein n=1 Tax=Thermoactinomyces sp. CICC 10522 TaxID=2767427 RepID=UPI0018DDEEAD|nr:hypothetical protein [Thermoactinomyces sp. CICC 10522]MBH8604111.1 hypothetical protein [Thermoactinomyces sp. CICC 10522]